MTKTDSNAYAAIIKIQPPEASGQATITIRLKPSDALEMNDEVKLLRDCTLAELQQYADQLEAIFWTDNKHRTLADLVADESVSVDMALTPPSEAKPDQPAAAADILLPDNWLDQIVILDDDAISLQPRAAAAEKTEAAPEAAAELPMAAAADASAAAPAADDAPPAESGAELADGQPSVDAVVEALVAQLEAAERGESGDDSAEIIVADSEPVHPEREQNGHAPTPTPATANERTLGLVRRIGHATPDVVDILLDEGALRAMQVHAKSSLNREVAGFMLGDRPEKQPDGRYIVHVTDAIIAKHTEMRGASVTYTPESWRYAQDKIAELYPDGDKVMVGWYHTHPGFGIFLSNMDLFIHHNFFTQKWHIAYVLDPRAERSGFFCWDRRQSKVSQYDFPWPHWARHSW